MLSIKCWKNVTGLCFSRDIRRGEKCHRDESAPNSRVVMRRQTNSVDGSADDQEPLDIVAMLRDSGLPAANRRYVYSALVNSTIEGWMPSRESVSLLIDMVAGRIDHGEYMKQVLRRWTKRSCGAWKSMPARMIRPTTRRVHAQAVAVVTSQ